jgi:hypothetical protein
MNGNTPAWKCRAFGDIVPEERDPIIKDIRMCAILFAAQERMV